MEIILLLIGLLVAGFFVQKYTTRCPQCKKLGTSSRTRTKRAGRGPRSFGSMTKRGKQKVEFMSDTWVCKNCGNTFNKTSIRKINR